jgi:hypothetical protein
LSEKQTPRCVGNALAVKSKKIKGVIGGEWGVPKPAGLSSGGFTL